MKASVVIITKNQRHLLEQSLPILLKQDLKGGYEIIVVDSGSTDEAREYTQSLPVTLVKIAPETFRFARAFNIGAKVAKGDFLVRLSGDVIPKSKDFLSELLSPFADSKVGATHGKYTLTGKKGFGYPNFWSADRFPPREMKYSTTPSPIKMIFSQKHREEVFNLAGACCAIRRRVWQERPFNENLTAAEDAEYALFLHLAGYNIVYNPKAAVIHEHKINSNNSPLSLKIAILEISWRIRLINEIVKLFFGRKLRHKNRYP